MPYRTYRPNFASLQRKYQVPTFNPEDETRRALETQKRNLEARLQGAGADEEVDGRNILKKALNLDEEQGLLMSTFEILNRPMQTVGGLLTEGPEGAVEGLKGNLQQTPVEVLDKLGLVDRRNLSGVGEFALNIGAGMAMDPLTYAGGIGGVLKKTGVIGKKTMKPVTFTEIQEISRAKATTALNQAKANPVKFKELTAKGTTTLDDGTVLMKSDYFTIKSNAAIKKGAGGVYETSAANYQRNLIAGHLDGVTDDLVVLQGKVSANDPDLEIFQRVTDVTGETFLSRVGTVEVKGLNLDDVGNYISSGARGVEPTLTLKGGTLNFSSRKGGIADRISEETKQEFLDYIQKNGHEFLPGEGVDDIFKVAERLYKKGGKSSQDLIQTSQLDDIFRKMVAENLGVSENPYVNLVIQAKQGAQINRIVSVEDLLKHVKFKSYLGKAGKEGKIRLGMTLGKGNELQTLMSLQDRSQDFMEQFLKTSTEFKDAVRLTKEPGIFLRALNAMEASQNKFLNTPATFAKNVGASLNTTFNASAGTDIYFKGKILRVGGKKKAIVNENMNRIQATKQYFEKQGIQDSGRLIQEIAESNSVRDAATGAVTTKARTYTTGEVLSNLASNTNKGLKTTLPRLSKRTRVRPQNIEANLNSALEPLGLKVKVEVNKQGYAIVSFIDADSNLDAISQLARGEMSGLAAAGRLNFGKLDLSEDALNLYKNHTSQIEEILNVRDGLTDLLVDELGFESLPEELRNKMGYMRHNITDEGKQFLRGKSAATENVYTRATDVFKKRQYMGTADEVNQTLRSFKELDADLLTTDAYESLADLVKTSSQKLEQKETIKAVLEGASVGEDSFFKVIPNNKDSLKELGPYYRKLDNTFDKEFKNMMTSLNEESQEFVKQYFNDLGMREGNALAIHKSAYNVLEKLETAYVEIPGFIKGYDKFLNYWKSMTLLTPGFHMRNFFGNHMNMYIAGMKTDDIAVGFKNAVSDIQRYDKIKDKVFNQGIKTLTKDELNIYNKVKYFREQGVAQSRRGLRDLEFINDMVYKKVGTKNPSLYNRLVTANYNVAERIDDYSRYNLYQWALTKGPQEGLQDLINSGAPEYMIENMRRANAAKTVSEALFDYQHLTSFERNVMKRFFPFYTFMKNNAIFQAKSMLTKPGKYARIGRAYDYWNENLAGIETEDLPDYMQDRMWLPIPMKVNKNDEEAINFLKLNLTPTDFTEFVRNPFRQGAVSVSAPIKLVFELGTGRDSFTGRPLSAFPGEQRTYDAEGVFPMVRDARGTIALNSNPVIQKVLNETGLRVPLNYASIATDGLDFITGKANSGALISQIGLRLGLTGTQTVNQMELTRLYQDLEALRDRKRLYEQDMGEPLPSLDELKAPKLP